MNLLEASWALIPISVKTAYLVIGFIWACWRVRCASFSPQLRGEQQGIFFLALVLMALWGFFLWPISMLVWAVFTYRVSQA